MFTKKKCLNCNGRLLYLNTPVVMGILNITPDSFYKKSRNENEMNACDAALLMMDEGAAVIDIGAQSTRPGAVLISADEEWKRLLPVLKTVRHKIPNAFISIDTFYSEVAIKAYQEGADIINDISGGSLDEKMFDTIAAIKLPYIIMHLQGIPQSMQLQPTYANVVKEVLQYLTDKKKQLQLLGVNDIIADVGFGFGKTTEHNYELLNALEVFKTLHTPLLVGISRKSMINKILNTNVDDALNGTTILNTVALIKGADILRVHDVKEAVQAISLTNLIK